MVMYQDVLQARFDFILGNSMTNLDIVAGKFMKLQQAVNNITGLKKIKSDLRDIGLGAKKSGAFFDLLTGKIVSTNEALRRMEIMQNKGTFFGKTASSIAGVQDVTPSLKGGNGAQNLIDNIDDVSGSMSILEDQSKSIGILMGLLFGGMTLQRWGTSMLRFVLPAMDKLEGYTSSGTKKVNAMKASFEFLKFSMFEAFTSTGLFKNFVEMIINASNWLAKFVSHHPELTMMVGILGGALVATGWFMQIVGGVWQFGMLWKILGNADTADAVTGGLKGIKTALGKISPVMWGIGAAALLFGLSLGAAYKKFPELKEQGKLAFDIIISSSLEAASSILDIFSVTIDTTDALYAFGSAANLVFLSFATGVSSTFRGIAELADWIKIAANRTAAFGHIILAAFKTANGGSFEDIQGNLESASSYYDKNYDIMLNAKDRADKFSESQDLLYHESLIATEGLARGKDEADKLREQYGLLGSNTVELNDAVSDNITKTKELEEASMSISDQFNSEISKVLETARAYETLADAKSKVGGSSLGSVNGREMVSDGQGGFIQKRYYVGSATGG